MRTKNLVEQFEKTYRQEKQKEAEELHNAIGTVLAEHKAEIQTVLYVLEMVKFELLREKYSQLFEAQREPEPGEIRFGKPE